MLFGSGDWRASLTAIRRCRLGACRRLVLAAALLAPHGAGWADPPLGSAERPLVAAYGNAPGPMFGQLPDGRLTGIIVDAMNLVAPRASIVLRPVALPWSRAQAMVEQGDADLMVTVPTEQRLKYVLFASRALYHDGTVAMYLKTAPTAARIAAAHVFPDLFGLAFVTYLGNGAIARQAPGQRIDWVKDGDTALHMIAAGHAEVLIDDELSAYYMVARDGLQNQIGMTLIDDPSAYAAYIGIRRSLPEAQALVERFDAAIASAERDGSLAALERRYRGANMAGVEPEPPHQ